jgi:LPS export ABC transporter protein LptC
MLLSDSYNNLSQIKLNASWQFFSVNTWQVPDKENPQSQNYLTSAKTSFQNQTNESLTEQLFIIQTKPKQTIIISSGKGKTKENDNIELSENVQIETVQTGEKNKPKAIQLLTTERFTYNDTEKSIKSDTLTRLQQDDFFAEGEQFWGNISTGEYRFKGQVKTQFIAKNNRNY